MTIIQYAILRLASQDAARINAGRTPRKGSRWTLDYAIATADAQMGQHCLTAPKMTQIWQASAALEQKRG